jgi:hypothetical protein
MKKLLLFVLALGFVVSAYTQKPSKFDKIKKDAKRVLVETDFQRETPLLFELNTDKAVSNVSRIPVGTSKSQRSFRREDTKVIHYNSDLDLLTMSFSLDPASYSGVDDPGVIGIFYSLDRGQTWSEEPVIVSDLTGEGLENYYLSGIAYNPQGNTDPMNAYGVYQGIATNFPAYTLWNKRTFGAATLGGENYFTEYFENDNADFEHDGYFNQFGLTQKQDFLRACGIIAQGPWANFTDLDLEVLQAEFNGSGFDWEPGYSTIDIPFQNNFEELPLWVGGRVFSDVALEVVWSDDGQIGYAWMGGLTTEIEAGFQPILFKTVNGGDDWDFVEIDFQESQWQEILLLDEATGESGYIPAVRNIGEEPLDYCVPWFNSTVGAVDANGNLQLFGDVSGHFFEFSEWLTADQNEFSTFTGAGNLMKFTVGEDENGNDGLIDIMWIDSLRSNPVADDPAGGNADLYCGSSGWLRRLQLSKNEESTQFFLTWTDTFDGDALVDNLSPDVFLWSYNIENGEVLERDPDFGYCLTRGTLYEGFYFFVQTSEYAMYDEVSKIYTIPMVNAVSPTDFDQNTNGAGDPVAVDYVMGIEAPLLVGIGDVPAAVSSFEVSQNQPNPFTGTTTIEISSRTVAPVLVEVTNIMGQRVYTMNAGTINGTKRVPLDASNLDAGVYFYTVTIGNERVSKKMIVE